MPTEKQSRVYRWLLLRASTLLLVLFICYSSSSCTHLMEFKDRSLNYRQQVDAVLETWLAELNVAQQLQESMYYSVFNGGKRVRPMLVYAAAEAIAAPSSVTDIAAAAVECMHAYSLVHDDLPAMDDDDLRRGKATCHIQFDEATAILSGDALQALAFTKLADSESSVALKLLRELGHASGADGMVGGQMLDLLAEGQVQTLPLSELQKIHAHKTGALIRASVRMGGMSAGASPSQLKALTDYANAIGLAFQVHDDIIDVCSDTETLGKPQGADVERGKSTYVSLLGLNVAREKAKGLIEEAKQALSSANIQSPFLYAMADYIIARQH